MSTKLQAPKGYFQLAAGRVSIAFRGRMFDNRIYGTPSPLAAIQGEVIAESFGFRSGDIFMPDVRPANGIIMPQKEFRRIGSKRVLNSVEADGVLIGKGQGALFCVRDCPVVIMASFKHRFAVAAHAGRKSLLGNYASLAPGVDPVQTSVLSAMVRSLGAWETSDIEVAIVLSIAAEHFPHRPDDPEWGETNRRMIDFVSSSYGSQCFSDASQGKLSLVELIKSQCRHLGIDLRKVVHDGRDTFSDEARPGFPAFYSHRRGDRSGGNAVLVTVEA